MDRRGRVRVRPLAAAAGRANAREDGPGDEGRKVVRLTEGVKPCSGLTSPHVRPIFRASRAEPLRRVAAAQSVHSGDIVPNIRSAKKDMRKSRAAAVRNRAQRSALRTALKKSLATSASADERTGAVVRWTARPA